jgi:hypothetical protein
VRTALVTSGLLVLQLGALGFAVVVAGLYLAVLLYVIREEA